MTQDARFAASEGDAWFERNRDHLAVRELSRHPASRLLADSGVRPASMLEIGASNGCLLHHLSGLLGCRATAVEPSAEAIRDGERRYPGIVFHQGLASAIPLAGRGLFDLVVVSFVLHWVDRSLLLASVAEIDRMVAVDGYLLVSDFYPPYPQRVPYHHLPGEDVWTYKQDYGRLFEASNLYARLQSLSCLPGTYETLGPGTDRIQATLYRKSLSVYADAKPHQG